MTRTASQKTPTRSFRKREEQRAAVENDPRWAAVARRDASSDGRFYYSVESTGVYCRPSCSARRPRPEHVRFHATTHDAERAGYRACRRCRPDAPPQRQQSGELITEACRWIEAQPSPPRLTELAGQLGVSASHLHRLFKAATGITPREYAAFVQARRMRRELATKQSVTQAIHGAGYASSARFYEKSTALLGMTPSAYRSGAPDLLIRFAVGECSLGSILVAATDRGVCAISLGDDPEALIHELERQFPRAELNGAEPGFERLVARVVGWVEQPRAAFDVPLDIRGTTFQQRVWGALRDLAVGSTTTYTELACQLGTPSAARAVARACAQNCLAVVIPCHRVVRKDGGLAGYRWGIERKQALLERESEG